jgi:hypothetical protein
MMLVPLSYLIGTRKPSLNCHNLNRVQIVQNQLHLMHNLIVRAPVKLQNPETPFLRWAEVAFLISG